MTVILFIHLVKKSFRFPLAEMLPLSCTRCIRPLYSQAILAPCTHPLYSQAILAPCTHPLYSQAILAPSTRPQCTGWLAGSVASQTCNLHFISGSGEWGPLSPCMTSYYVFTPLNSIYYLKRLQTAEHPQTGEGEMLL